MLAPHTSLVHSVITELILSSRQPGATPAAILTCNTQEPTVPTMLFANTSTGPKSTPVSCTVVGPAP